MLKEDILQLTSASTMSEVLEFLGPDATEALGGAYQNVIFACTTQRSLSMRLYVYAYTKKTSAVTEVVFTFVCDVEQPWLYELASISELIVPPGTPLVVEYTKFFDRVGDGELLLWRSPNPTVHPMYVTLPLAGVSSVQDPVRREKVRLLTQMANKVSAKGTF